MTIDKSKEQRKDQCHRESFRMVALDLDGTLLGPDHKLSDATVDYLRKLHQRGFIVTIATGRSPGSVAEHFHRLKLPFPCAGHDLPGFPMVNLNGAQGLIATPLPAAVEGGEERQPTEGVRRNGRKFHATELFHDPLPRDVTVKALKLAEEMGHVANYYHGSDVHARPINDEQMKLTERYGELCGIRLVYVPDYETVIDRGLPSKVLILCEDGKIDETYEALRKSLEGEAHVIRGSPPFFVEILNKDVCKGHGFRKLCEVLKVRPSECVAFGDGDNDREMLSFAGKGVAMKNARQVVKDAADEVTKFTNAEDGVIRHLMILEERGLLQFGSNSAR